MKRRYSILIIVLCDLFLILAAHAGKANAIAANPEAWKPVKGEFEYIHGQEHNLYNPDFRLEPKYYDLFAGLSDEEERIERIHLAGWWKLRRLPDTMTEPVWDEGAVQWSGGKELVENDIGLKEKFWETDYDDSEWPWFFVPWDWNRRFRGTTGKSSYDIGGVGWFRRTFHVGEVVRGYRFILHFEYVDRVSTVWVNGKKIGTYTVYETHPGGHISRGNSAEQHSYDITHAVKPNAANQITVRVFHNGLHAYKAGTHLRCQAGGIWQPVWLDMVPPVYAETIYVTPNLSDSSVSLRCFLRNTFPKSRALHFRVRVKPWHSYRYAPPVEDAPATEADLGTEDIASGRSDVTFVVKLKDPVTWDHEQPILYHVQLYAAKPGRQGVKETLVGQARFGFREFTTDGTQFRLNGKRIFLGGIQKVNEPYRGDALLAANNKDWCAPWFKRIRNANVIFMRWSAGHYTEPFHDTADEAGMLLVADRLLTYNYEDTPEFEASVKRLIDSYYNHAGVVLYSLGNEHFSGGCGREKILKWAPSLTKIYDLYKKYDTTRPITCCSGSAGVAGLKNGEYDKWPKTDYHDNHDYTGGGSGHTDRIPESIRRWRETHARTDLDGPRPYINGEAIAISPLKGGFFDALKKDLPDLDRKTYAQLVKEFGEPAAYTRSKGYGGWFVSVIGLGTFLEDLDASVASTYGRILEFYRIHGMEQVGFALHALGREFRAGPRKALRKRAAYTWGTVYNVLQEKLQPVYAMCAELNRNCFAGKPLSFRLIAMNDTMRDLSHVSVSAAIMDDGAKKAEEVIRLPSFTQEKHHYFDVAMNVPDDLRTGHYRLALIVKDQAGATVATNGYRLHVSGKEPLIGKEQIRKVAVYTGKKNQGVGLQKVLDELGVVYDRTIDFSALENYGLLIIGPLSFDDHAKREAYKIHHFLRNGGRVLVLNQHSYDPDPIAPGLFYHRFHGKAATTTDIVTLTHPVFQGLDRKDFHLWNRKQYPVRTALTPLTAAVLAATYPVSSKLTNVGMAVGEVAVGKGVYMFSQLKAIDNYETDSVAARYVNNLIRYCVADDWTAHYAVKAPKGSIREKFKRPEPKSCFFIDLRSHCNKGFIDEVADDQKGGWADDGAERDMRVIPLGRQIFIGVPFDIIDPAKNNGKSCIVLGGRHKIYFQDRVENIKIGRKLSHLYFLVASTWTGSSVGKNIGKIVFHYEWGGLGTTTIVSEDLVVGRNVFDWTALSNKLPDAAIAFEKMHPLLGEPVGALVIPWENPIPEERIESIDIVSSGKAIPVIIAVTGTTKVKTRKAIE